MRMTKQGFEPISEIIPRVIDQLFNDWNAARDQRRSLEPDSPDTPFDSSRSLKLDATIIEEESAADGIVKRFEQERDER